MTEQDKVYKVGEWIITIRDDEYVVAKGDVILRGLTITRLTSFDRALAAIERYEATLVFAPGVE